MAFRTILIVLIAILGNATARGADPTRSLGVLAGASASEYDCAPHIPCLAYRARDLHAQVRLAGSSLSVAANCQGLGRRPVSESDQPYATRGNLVIGKVGDLTKAGALREGERTLLSELPNLGSPKANWAQNSGRLRAAMGESSPIRDATVDSAGNLINNTGFLRAERNLLDSRGWIYKADTTMWHPPMLSP